MDFQTYMGQPLPFKEDILKYFSREDNLVIFDIGACEGEDSIKLKRLFPNSKIYSFEPLPPNIKKIKKHFKDCSENDIEIVPLALSDKDGKAVFHVSSGHPEGAPKDQDWDYGNKSSSLLPPKEHLKTHEWIKFNKSIEVKTQKLKTFCQDNSIEKINFIYLDVQGAELNVLRGAEELINNVDMVWMEVEAIELYKGQPLKRDVEKFMQKNDFVKLKDTVDNISGDQLYVKKDLQGRSFINKVMDIAKRLKI